MAAPMAMLPRPGKLYPPFTSLAHPSSVPEYTRQREGRTMLVGLAVALFIALFGWGANYFGWDDPDGKVRLALFTCFILGALCGHKSKG
jgi:hypothetical protein